MNGSMWYRAILVAVALTGIATASSALPPCPESGYRNNCFGTKTFPDGDKYVGEWRDDKAHGQGTFTFANGAKYVGEWKDDKRNGQGTLTLADGTVLQEGIWKDNVLVTSVPSLTFATDFL